MIAARSLTKHYGRDTLTQSGVFRAVALSSPTRCLPLCASPTR